MIKLLDIRDSTVKSLSTLYPDITIYDERQQQGMKFPCFFVQIIPISTRRYKAKVNKDKALLTIQYFSDEDKTSECLEVKDMLDTVFSEAINVSGQILKANSVEFDTKREVKGSSLSYIITLDYYNVIREDETYAPIGGVSIKF